MSDSTALALPAKFESYLPSRLAEDKESLDGFKATLSGLPADQQKQIIAFFVPPENNADIAFGDFVNNPNAWTPSYARIVQKELSPPIEGVKIGDILIDGNAALKTPATIIPLGFWRTRTFWQNNNAVCKSHNALNA